MADMKGYGALQARLRAISGAPGSVGRMKLLGAAAVMEQKRLTQPNKKTGVTQNSIHVSSVSATSATTEAAAAARWLEFGTKPHVIRPRVARVLAWASGPAGGANRRLTGATRKGASADHFAMVVNHPGTRAYPFMVPGAKLALEKAGLAEKLIIEPWNSAA